MGWFNEQIRQREKNDADLISEVLHDITNAVTGKNIFFQSGNAENEMQKILEYYGLKARELPENIKDEDSQIEYLTRPYGIMKRKVRLKPGWHKDGDYPMLARQKDGTLAALIPRRFAGYSYTDKESGQLTKVLKKTENLFEEEAYCFYKPYSSEILTSKELLKELFKAIKIDDLLLLIFSTFLIMLLSLIVPGVYKIIFSHIAVIDEIRPLVFVSIVLTSIVISKNVITAVKKLIAGRIKNKLQVSCESAVMMRILSLPTSFFRIYSAGELSSKVGSIKELSEAIAQTLISLGITSFMSLLYMIWILAFVPKLFIPTFVPLFLALALSFWIIKELSKRKEKQNILIAEEEGISYSLISGISKIKLVGAEKRTFAKWGGKYAQKAELMYNLPFVVKVKMALYTLITMLGSAWVYYEAAKIKISISDFYAFTIAHGAVFGALFIIFLECEELAGIKPKIKNILTFFEVKSEISSDKETITHLSGGIEMNNVKFHYGEGRMIFNNFSIKIRPGEYLAVVGETGSGKSTLLRLLLGFENPQKGGVYYDGKDLSKLDLKSLRQKIGVVMQDGKLFSGSIFANIAISAPNLTLDAAWEAAEAAGVAQDIRNMPMGMNTLISEGSGSISGGQRQRILIARALAAKPRIILFDEATNALDNITQKIVSETLDNLKCTRIVAAQRLSTIKNCARIIVLDEGRAAEDGTYEELMKKNGLFAKLVRRQEIK